MPTLGAIEVLFREYATGSKEAVAALIGGTVGANILNPAYKAYKDTCAIRVSRSLNYSGTPIPWAGGGIEGVRTDKGGDSKYYIYSTHDIRKYLNSAIGQAKSFEGNITKKDVAGIKGIIAFGYLHIDLWDGSQCAGTVKDGYFGEESIAKEGIRIWPTHGLFDTPE